MFDIGWSELLVIGVVAIVVVGPKDLPRLMRTFGHYTGKIRGMARDFQRQFEDAVRDSEIDEVRKAMQDIHAQASEVTRAAVDKPLMTPKSAAPAPAAVVAPAVSEPAPKPKPRPRAKKPKGAPEDTAAAGALAAAPEPASPKAASKSNSRSDGRAKTASGKKPRAGKREEGAA
jgi:sec-independent protein translocase protein TatB